MNKEHCSGCDNDCYNNGIHGVKECWSLKDAKLVMKKKVHVEQTQPWNQKPIKVPDCYKVRRYVFITPRVSR